MKKYNTCFSSSDGEDIAGFTGAQAGLGKHADVVSWGVYLHYCGLCLVGAEVYYCLCVIPWGCRWNKMILHTEMLHSIEGKMLRVEQMLFCRLNSAWWMPKKINNVSLVFTIELQRISNNLITSINCPHTVHGFILQDIADNGAASFNPRSPKKGNYIIFDLL